jgi:hypothetical protein
MVFLLDILAAIIIVLFLIGFAVFVVLGVIATKGLLLIPFAFIVLLLWAGDRTVKQTRW